jgi:hypothetical protein
MTVVFPEPLMREMQYDSGLVFERVVGYRKGVCLWGEDGH